MYAAGSLASFFANPPQRAQRAPHVDTPDDLLGVPQARRPRYTPEDLGGYEQNDLRRLDKITGAPRPGRAFKHFLRDVNAPPQAQYDS